MKKLNITKRLLVLTLVVGLITSQGIVINAAESDEVTFGAEIGTESEKLIAVISTDTSVYGEKDFEISLKYYNCSHQYISSKSFVKENTWMLLIDDEPPSYADHILVRFYSNDVLVGQEWVHIWG